MKLPREPLVHPENLSLEFLRFVFWASFPKGLLRVSYGCLYLFSSFFAARARARVVVELVAVAVAVTVVVVAVVVVFPSPVVVVGPSSVVVVS